MTKDRGARNTMATPLVLLVEDNLADQRLAQRALKRSGESYQLTAVSSGEEALEYLEQSLTSISESREDTVPRPDLILLDLNMPGMGGLALLTKLRSSKQFANIPVVVLTNSERKEDMLESYDRGCASYIKKPHSLDKLIELFSDLSHYWFRTVSLPERKLQEHDSCQHPDSR